MEFTLVCDIMINLEGSIRPAMYLANDLVARGYEVSMMSPIMSPDVERCLQMRGIKPLNLQVKHVTRNSSLSLLWFETWMHEASLKLNSRRVSGDFCISINFSQVILTPSLFWYLHRPPSMSHAVAMYEPLEIVKREKYGKVLTEPKELIRIRISSWNKRVS